MTQSPIVVTAGDATFFELVQGCIQSIRDQPAGKDIAIAFLDVGCTEQQRAWLRTRVDSLHTPEWEFEFPGREQMPTYLKGLSARPFLRRHLPDHEVYVWLDADAWIQDWRAVDLLVQGARRRQGLAIVPEIDRGFQMQYGHLPHWWEMVESWYAATFDAEIARQLRSFPLLNAGVFAIDQQAPHWSVWETCLREALRRGCTLLTDQMALNLAVYGQGLFARTELLPAWVNWTCHAGLPAWDAERGRIVEPYLPHTPIGILHLSGPKDLSDPAGLHYPLSNTEGGKSCVVSLRYPPTPVVQPPTPSSSGCNHG